MSSPPIESDAPPLGDGEGNDDLPDEISTSFLLTTAFLDRHPRYLEMLSLTPEHFRLDAVLWRSGVAMLRALLEAVAEDVGLEVSEEEVREAARNLLEGVVLRAGEWES